MKIRIELSLHGVLFSFCVAILLFSRTFPPVFAQDKNESQTQALVQQLQDKDKQVRLAAIKEAKKLG
ncbi:MAG: hypothetical protein ABIP14_08550, partial [Blastocatellia bacterium]